MIHIRSLIDHVRALLGREEGQDGVEYMLVTGVIVVAVLGFIISGMGNDFLQTVINAVEGAIVDFIGS